MKTLITLTLSLLCAAESLAVTAGQYEVRRYGTNGMQTTWVTLSNGQVLGQSGGVPAAVTPASAIGSITGLGTGVATALAVNIGSAGAPVLFNGAGGTPSSITLTNATGTASGLTAGSVTTIPNLTGHVTSAGNTTSLGSFTLAQLNTAVSDADLAALVSVNVFTPPVRTSGSSSYFTVTPPADTTLTASTESIGVNFPAVTRQFSSGALALQREHFIGAPTYAFTGASTVTNAITLDVADPVAGTNATLTNKFGIRTTTLKATTAHIETIIGTAGNVLLFNNASRFQISGMSLLIGTQAAPSALIESQGSGEQLRLRYDASNYTTFTQSSALGMTFNCVAGTTPQFIFSDPIVASEGVSLASGKTVSLNGTLISGGSGSPESVITAPVGSLYLRSDGGAGTAIYVKESGSGNTGWIAK